MQTWLTGKKTQRFFWTVIPVYLFRANRLSIPHFLKDIKPVASDVFLPSTRPDFVYQLDTLPRSIRYKPEDLYERKGF